MIRIGTDIVEISRVEKKLKSPAFQKRVYSEKELAADASRQKGESMAARFCAKEALIKVFGKAVPLREITVRNDENGRPYYELEGSAEELRRQLKIEALDLSLSHCREYAVAFAIGQCSEERKD